MQNNGESHRRKVFAGIAMIAAPLALGAAFLIRPATPHRSHGTAHRDTRGGQPARSWALLYIAASVLLALAPLGHSLIVESDDAWERPVRFEGFFHPVGAH